MGKRLPHINKANNTWNDLVNLTNDITDTIANDIPSANSDPITGNINIRGRLDANTIYENGYRLVNQSFVINTTNGIAGGGSLSANLSLYLTNDTIGLLNKANTALQKTDFTNKIGLKDKINVSDINTVGTANSSTVLWGDGTWKNVNVWSDMSKQVYDPTLIMKDVFDRTNHYGQINVKDVSGLDGVISGLANTYVQKFTSVPNDGTTYNVVSIDTGNRTFSYLRAQFSANTGYLRTYLHGSEVILSGVNTTSISNSYYVDINPTTSLVMGANTSNIVDIGNKANNIWLGTTSNQLQVGINAKSVNIGSASNTDLTINGKSIKMNGSLVATGDLTAFSDESLKTNIEKIPNALEKVNSLNGYTFDRIDLGNKRGTGVIAQEVEKVLPEAVSKSDDKLVVAYGNIIGLLIEAIKELNEKVNNGVTK